MDLHAIVQRQRRGKRRRQGKSQEHSDHTVKYKSTTVAKSFSLFPFSWHLRPISIHFDEETRCNVFRRVLDFEVEGQR